MLKTILHFGVNAFHDTYVISFTVGETLGTNAILREAYISLMNHFFAGAINPEMVQTMKLVDTRDQTLATIETSRTYVHALIDGDNGTMKDIVGEQIEKSQRIIDGLSKETVSPN